MSKKITFILGSMAGGGAERVVSNLAKFYDSKHYKINIILLLNNRVDYQLPQSVKLTYISADDRCGLMKPFVWLKRIRKELKKSNPSIIVSFFAKINLLVLLSAFGMNAPIYISERNDPQRDGRGVIIKLLTFLLYPLSKGVIFQTNHAKSCFPKVIQNKASVIPNPIDIDFDFSKNKKLNKSVVAVGKLMEQKNHKLLIEAFGDVCDDFPEYKLYIYGEGELKNKLVKLINKKNLQNNVFLQGRTKNIFDAVYHADLFVLSSNYEGLSNALLESMMLETPVVSTNCAGSNEIIIDGFNGSLAEVNDRLGLANAIKENLKNYEKSRAMAKNAKKSVENYSLNKVCISWDNFLNS